MISEGSCDTEDWSNDAENSALLHRISYSILCILQYIVVFCIFCNFNQINAALLSIRELKSEIDPKPHNRSVYINVGVCDMTIFDRGR